MRLSEVYTLGMEIAQSAREAANTLKVASNSHRTAALKAIHDRLRDHKDEVMAANRKDVEAAQTAELSPALIKRLELTSTKYDTMLQGILDVSAFEDPVGKLSLDRELDENLHLYRMTCPIGVLLVIFEARPEVIAQIGSLAIKSGNAAILKGGSESKFTFTVISGLVQDALSRTTIPKDALQLITTRDAVADLLTCDKYIDMVIPRGSNQLVRSIKKASTIPVLGHADGICAIYLDQSAVPDMAARIVNDAKTNYPAGCNAVETVLVNENAPEALQAVILKLHESGVTIFANESIQAAAKQLGVDQYLQPATDEHFDTEFLSLQLAMKTVANVEEAVQHINAHGSHHTDVIVTEDETSANKFLRAVDSAGVYWNVSTRFADGYRYGFGAEVGVSTNKLHARGPVGLDGLMSYQYLLKGAGQVAGDYVGAGGQRHFQVKDFPINNNN